MSRSDVAEILFMFVSSAAVAWVFVFRPEWANKLLGRWFRITPCRGKIIAALMLGSFVYQAGWLAWYGPVATPGNAWLFRQFGALIGHPQ